MIEKAVLVLICGVMDRIRGMSTGLPTWFEMIFYGAAISLLVNPVPSILNIAIIVLFWTGSIIGWGNPINKGLEWHKDEFEWWQYGFVLKNNWVVALILRGFMWGLPLLPLTYWIPNIYVVPIAFAVAMPLAVYLARIQNVYTKDKWAVQEVLRGLFAGALISIGMIIT